MHVAIRSTICKIASLRFSLVTEFSIVCALQVFPHMDLGKRFLSVSGLFIINLHGFE